MLNSIAKTEKKNTTFNLTSESKTIFYYPKNYSETKKILSYIKKIKKKILIKSGNCGYGDKSNLRTSEYSVSLSELNKIIKFDKKNEMLTAQAGINLYKLFSYLKEKGFIIYNIPGGESVTLGGAISGNVHGRPSKKKFTSFGDNIVSLKVMFENGKIKTITKNNKIFYKIIGGLGIYVIILEAKLKIHKINNNYIEKINKSILNENVFKKFQKKVNNYYGYINHFNMKNFEGNFIYFIPKKDIGKKKIIQLKKFSILKFLNIFKIPYLSSFLINPYTLKIFYNLLFFINKNIKLSSKNEIFTLEKSMYFDLIQIIPHFFKRGMIEIQFSIKTNRLLTLISNLKKNFYNFNIFPFYFILKQMDVANQKYLFNFPKNKSCITLAFSKKDYDNNKIYFNNLYKILIKNKCDFYITKDETFVDNISKTKLKKYIDLNFFSKSKILSSDFKEKVLGLNI